MNFGKRLLPSLVLAVSLLVIILVVTTPMDLGNQLVFGVVSAILVFLMGQVQSRRILLAMILITAISSTRYIYWRITQTLVTDGLLPSILSFGLLAAECYAWLVLLLSFFQTARPLEREVVPLPEDESTWPTVDVYIPTYNESLDVVKNTVLAALNIDYPADKLQVYLLDDGRRPEFGAFASAAGVGYITREDNTHAKAGNLNNAMRQTDGELICIFDCDHVPTRGFLKETAGAFLTDEKLALLQTPHHFYSPDPFERNLVVGRNMPHEGELFYGPVQKGNDFWNAAFFCGSCALLRRSALEEVGGFAVETVTEDAHTALKLQRKGWSTAFLGKILAAGLATERLALHIGQRARWCRGMIQILRTDNPLFGPGLSFSQRLCYLSAMLHFQFPLARVVFLTAPLAYLLFGMNIIEAAPKEIGAYVLPHLFCIIYTNSRAVGRYRFTFWNEIYETVLAFHLLKPALVTLFDPKRGKFNVTEKGGVLEKGFVDFETVQPHIFVLLLLLAGTIWGVVRLFLWDLTGVQYQALLFNLAWAGLSALFLLASIAVASETRQVRRSPRIPARLPAILHLNNGHTLRSHTRNVSDGGVQLDYPTGLANENTIEYLEVTVDDVPLILPVEAVAGDKELLQLKFPTLTLRQQQDVAHLVFGRNDAWESRKEFRDRPLRALFAIIQSIAGLFFVRWRDRKLYAREHGAGEASRKTLKAWALHIAFIVLVVLGILMSQSVSAEGRRLEADQHRELALPDLWGGDNLRLQGNYAQAHYDFSLRQDEVATKATLLLDMSFSDAMLEKGSQLEVSLNGYAVERIALNPYFSEALQQRIELPPQLILVNNSLQFRLIGETAERCDNQLSKHIWLEFAPTSTLNLTLRRIPPVSDLAHFPLPFFDADDMRPLRLPVVLPPEPDELMLAAAGIVTSQIGVWADYRPTQYPVFLGGLPDDYAIVFARPDDVIDGLSLPPIEGPEIHQIAHPRNPLYRLLVVAGRDSAELRTAARYLATHSRSLRGRQVKAEAIAPTPRKPNDAPRWQNPRQPIPLEQIARETGMHAEGIRHPANRFSFRLPPDLFVWPGDDVRLMLEYRFPEGEWLDPKRSRLEAWLNGEYLGSYPAVPRGPLPRLQQLMGFDNYTMSASIGVPPELLYGSNELGLYFDLAVKDSDDCRELPERVRATLLPSSHLDIRAGHTFASLPELSLFASGGYPFTRLADLAETTVLLPDTPDAHEISAALDLLSAMGAATGHTALAVEVRLGLELDGSLANRDLLVVASRPALEGIALLENTPFHVEQGRLVLQKGSLTSRAARWLRGDLSSAVNAQQRLEVQDSSYELLSFISPLNKQRSVVVAAGRKPQALPQLSAALRVPAINASIRGDLALFYGGEERVLSYNLGSKKGRGDLLWHKQLRWHLGDYPLSVLLAALLVVLALALWIDRLLDKRSRKRLASE